MNRIKICLLTLLISASVPSMTWAAADTADAALEKLAKKGDTSAMIQLGKWYAGLSSNKDNGKAAAEWFKKAMNKGSDEGRWLYAGVLADGLTGKIKIDDAIKVVEGRKDTKAEEEFYRKGSIAPETPAGQANLILAATMGNIKAMYRLGNLYAQNKMIIQRSSPTKNRKTGLTYMERAATAGYIPAMMWLIDEYGEEDKIKQTEMKDKLAMLKTDQLTTEDFEFIASTENWKIVEQMTNLKVRRLSKSDYLALIESVIKSPVRNVKSGKLLTILSNNFHEVSDTTLIDRFKPIAKVEGENSMKRVCFMDIATMKPTRQIAAVKTINRLFRVTPSEKAILIKTLEQLAEKEHDGIYEEMCSVLLKDNVFSDHEVKLLCDTYDHGVPDGLKMILKLALKYNPVAVNWLEGHAESGTADMQGTLGTVYATPNSPFYDKKKAIFWLEKAARNGKPSYKEQFPSLFKKDTPKPKTQPKPEAKKQPKKKSNTTFQESGIKR